MARSLPGRLRAVAPCLAFLAFAGIAVGTSIPASAHGYKLGAIAVGHVWAPPPATGGEGLSVYGPMLNRGGTTVRLVGVSSPVADRVRIRIEKDGEARWRDSIELKPGKPFALAPWREHIRLSGLRKPLAQGDSFDLTLDFGDAGKLTVKVMVGKAGAH